MSKVPVDFDPGFGRKSQGGRASQSRTDRPASRSFAGVVIPTLALVGALTLVLVALRLVHYV